MRRHVNTVRRKTRQGHLPRVNVPGSRKAWYRAKDIELLGGFGTTLEREPGELPGYLDAIRTRFPHFFTP